MLIINIPHLHLPQYLIFLPIRVSDPYPDPDPHGSALIRVAGSGSGSRRDKKPTKIEKKTQFSCFKVLDVLF
jgi:hypothetical protein